MIARYEWALMLLIPLALGVAELISVNRSIRRPKPSPESARHPEG